MNSVTPRHPRLDVGKPAKRVAPSVGRPRRRPKRQASAHTVASPAGRTRGRRSRCRWACVAVLSLTVAGITISEAVQYRQARVWGAELFLLEEIRVSGAERFSAEEILAVLDLSRGETDMTDVVPGDIHDVIATEFPDLLDVAVTRDVPAGALSIAVIERQPIARVISAGPAGSVDGVEVIDGDGVVLLRPFATPTEGGDPGVTADDLPSIAVDGPATVAGMFDGPEVFRALRLIQAYEDATAGRQPADVGVRLGSVDARNPSRIEVGLLDATGGRRTAILAEQTMAAGLRNVMLVTRQRAAVASRGLTVVSSDGEAEDTESAEGVKSGRTELIDARFESTVYVKSIPGGQDG